MPDWYKGAIQTLIKVYQEDQTLFTEIQLVIKQIQRDPLLGDYVQSTYRVYYDPETRFRIGYNYHPKAKELEIVVLHILNH